ncbi:MULTISPECIES: hypothetical protein [unclassified Novosphingobium]|uniref:hypothetical protein n=1 Tax=unclassified Novosphingobium TaxID=2644732 RepID=UPI000D2F92D9|nr:MULTISPECIES: hypothetical protein [unclassified Novosphingobium]PTR05231.1 hypothetical protein C8K11_1397 [Novosphingobium sp. GV055]PUA93830.1 hypothetical protein C8K12_1397 [Novosphingobium sp. GV061]PUB10824.1 hypothetical protein C8K14_1397 [Novosphingobium sp. GV079]PUB36468.1 hypothetical protein C8K10_1397 [Novosphingobium sp. GV027]
MARPKTKENDQPADDGGEVYNRPDAAKALKILDEEIKPREAFIAEKRGDLSDPHRRIKDECHFPRMVLNFISQLDGMEDAKLDHVLLALHLGLEHRNYHRPFDLVAMAVGAAPNDPVVKTSARRRPKLVTVPDPDFDDGDFAAAADVDPTNLKLN